MTPIEGEVRPATPEEYLRVSRSKWAPYAEQVKQILAENPVAVLTITGGEDEVGRTISGICQQLSKKQGFGRLYTHRTRTPLDDNGSSFQLFFSRNPF